MPDSVVESKLAELNELKNELDKLDERFDRQLKTLGLTKDDLRKLDRDNPPPEVRPAIEKARQAAKLAGEAVARDNNFKGPPASKPRRSRAGAIKI